MKGKAESSGRQQERWRYECGQTAVRLISEQDNYIPDNKTVVDSDAMLFTFPHPRPETEKARLPLKSKKTAELMISGKRSELYGTGNNGDLVRMG